VLKKTVGAFNWVQTHDWPNTCQMYCQLLQSTGGLYILVPITQDFNHTPYIYV